MIKKSGFTIIELLFVIAIIGILAYLSYFLYLKYKTAAANAQLISDLRNCIETIAIYVDTYGESLNETVQEYCVKSPYTKDIIVVSSNPLVLKAISAVSNMTCTYNSTTGQVVCDNPLKVISE
jgi:prepilin-type N-terminal cleavage/methylation domain-containing protein